ncbi:HlyD family type I secretion periplasmic adaptor subunit [Emcibacter nanhaiensis]|uniref:Membrane fusion protein (MFP) family protein n=1 Tax=Emcibacter nanhaiensis TaxID=1505037 RepID=A0A501PT39_9PROT|nr:HlyD family type I secretion periplasmic adaptor subunit [Emcibacter nanhaiensis]TPD63222.1 HlyD family type I secretion periplasmic adaptor subunit [Emcibacter nanhaiensis]
MIKLPFKFDPSSAQHLGANVLFYSIVAFVVLFFIWASFSELDEVTRGMGRVVPAKQIQVVQNLEGGIIKEILVKSGQEVKAGDILVRMDSTQLGSDLKKNEEEYLALDLKTRRLQAETDLKAVEFPEDLSQRYPDQVARELNLNKARLSGLRASLSGLEAKKKNLEQELIEARMMSVNSEENEELAQAEIDMIGPLVEKGIEPRISLIRAQQKMTEAKSERQRSELGIEKAKKSIEEVELNIEQAREQFRTETLSELSEAQSRFNQLRETIPALSDRVYRTDVVAPTDGIVNQVLVTTVGGVVKPGMSIVELVPSDDSLLVEAEIRPQDIAFLYPGQAAKVKITAYDFARYGALDGTVETISADAILNEREEYVYIAKIRTKQNSLEADGDTLPIIPGMVADVNIVHGKKTILEYLINPVLRLRDNALRER